jgi:thiamine biosynthesis protein ThiS
MKLIINGNETESGNNLTVSRLLEDLEIEPAGVAVEVNLNIIKKCDYEKHALEDGDTVEIVNFVGGG